jgi:fibronectin-binding autotransporter adhesin
MTPSAPSFLARAALLAAAGIALLPQAQAQITWTNTATSGSTGVIYNVAGNWSNGAAPTSGNTYQVSGAGRYVRSIDAATSAFTGGLLTFTGGSVFELYRTNSGTAISVAVNGNGLVFDNATLRLTTSLGTVNYNINQAVTIGSGGLNITRGSAGGYGLNLNFNNTVSGSGNINWTVDATGSNTSNVLNFRGGNFAGYSGNITITGPASTKWADLQVGTSGWGSGNLTLNRRSTLQTNTNQTTTASETAIVTIQGSTSTSINLASGSKLILSTLVVRDGGFVTAVTNNTGEIQIRDAGTVTLNAGSTASTFQSAFRLAGNSTWNIGDVTASTASDLILGNAGDSIKFFNLYGSGTLTKTGTGTVALSGTTANFTGTLDWQAGALDVITSGALGNHALTFASGTTFQVSGTTNLTVAGALTGAGGLNKSSSGTLTLNAANLTGTHTISGGKVVLAGTSVIGGASTTVDTGAVLESTSGLSFGAGQTLSPRGAAVNDASAADLIGNLSFTGGTSNAAPGGILTVGGESTYGTVLLQGNLNVSGFGQVRFDLGSAATVGAGSSDLLRVAGDITLSAGASFMLSGSSLASDTYRLVTYTGALTGFDNLSIDYFVASRSTFTKVHNEAAKAIDVTIISSSANLLWSGAASTWDESTQSFTNLGTSAADRFFATDSVAFDDTGAANSTVTLVGNLRSGAVTFSGSTNYTLSGTGSLAFTTLAKSGSSTVTLGTGFTSSSGVTVSGGTLRLATGSSLTGAVTVSNGARLAVVDLTGLSLATTTINGGRLEIEATSGAFNQDFTVGASGATLAVTRAGANLTRTTAVAADTALTFEVTQADAKLALSNAWTSAGSSLTKTGAGILAVTQNIVPSSWTVSEGILSFGDSTTTGSTSSAVSVASGATVRFNRSANPNAQSSGAISGAGNVEFFGINDGISGAVGIYTANTANTYSGTTFFTGARVNTSNTSQFGTSTLDIGRTGQLYVSTANLTFANDMILRGQGWADNAGTGSFGNVRFDAAGTLTGTITLAASDVRISASGLTISGVIRDDATGGRGFSLGNPDNSTAGGTLTLTGANTFSGPVRVNRGTLAVASLNSVVSGQASSNLGAPTTVERGTIHLGSATVVGTLTYTGAGETTDRVLNLAGTTGSATVNNNGAGTLRLTSAITATGVGVKTLTLAGTGSFTLDGALVDSSGGTTALTKTGASVLTLNAASSFSGGFSLGSGGTLLIGDDLALGTGTANLGNGGTAIVRSTSADARTLANAITYSNNLTFGGAGSGNLTFTGAVNLGSGAKTATVDNAVTEFSGVLSRSAGVAFTKEGAGTLILSGENTFFAGSSVVVNAGTLQVGKGGTSGSLGPATLQNNAVTRFERSDNLTFSQIISGNGTLVQAGTGDLILAAANTYTGLTQVNAGRLVLGTGGSLVSNAIVDLRGGGLAFTGGQIWTAGQTLRINGAGTVGAATLGSLNIGGGTVGFDIDSTTSYDALTVSAGSTLEIDSATFAINVLAGILASGTYDLINYTGATFTDTSLAGPLSGITLQGIATTGSRQSVSLVNASDKISLVVSGSTASLTWTNAATNGVWRIRDEVTDIDDTTPGNWQASGSPGGLLTHFYQNDGVTFDGTAAGTVTLTGALTAGTVTVSGSANHTFAGTGSLAAGSLTKSGSGKLTLNATLATTGGITLTAGEIEVATAADNATSIAVQGGVLRLTSGGVTSVNATGGRVIIAAVGSLGSTQFTLDGGLLEITATTGAFESGLSLVASSATISVSSAGAALTRSTPTNLLGNLTLDIAAADASLAVSSLLTGNGNLTKTGTGTLTLSAINTFTGNVLVSGGTLRAGLGSAFGASNTANTKVTVAAGAAVDIMGSALVHGFTIAGTGVGGTGAITNTGALVGPNSAQISNIRLSANASIGGTGNWALLASAYAATSLDLAGFTLTKTGVNTIGLATTTVTAGLIQVDAGFINFGGGSGGSGVTAASTSLVLSNISGAGLIVSRDSSIGSLAGGGASGGNLALNGGTFTVGGLNTNTSFAGVISGGGNLTKTGTGTLLLGSASTLTGASGTFTVAGGTLDLGGLTHTTAGALAVNTGSLVNGTISAAGNFSSSGNATISAILTGAGTFTKTGSATVTTLSNATYLGATAVSSGTLELASANTLTGAATVSAGATLRLSGTNTLANVTTSGSAATILVQSGANVTAGTLATSSATGSSWTVETGATLNATNFANAWTPNSFVVNGVLNLSSTSFEAFRHATNGSMTIGGTGTINIAGGLNTANSTGSSPLLNVTRFNLGGGDTAIAFTRNSGAVRLGTSTIGIFGQNWSTNANSSMELVEETTGTTFDTLDSADGVTARTMTLAAALSGAGKLNKVGAGTLVLGVANTYTGATSVTGGSLRFVAGGLASTTSITVNGGTLEWAASNTDDLSARLALGAAGATLNTGANNVAFASGLSAAGNLAKSGTGTLTLGAAGTVAGAVSVNAGQLLINHSGAIGSAAVAIGADATVTLGFTPVSTLTLTNTFTGLGTLEIATTSETNLVTLANISGFNGDLRLVSGYLDNTGFSGNLIYTGGRLTDISALTGTLVVEGAYLASQGLPADVLLSSGGSLDFIGVTGAPLTATINYAGGTLANAAAYNGIIDIQSSGLTLATGSLGSGTVRVGNGLSATVGANFTNDVRLEGTGSLTNDLSNFAATVILGNLATYNLGTDPDSTRTADFRLTSGSRLAGQGTIDDLTVESGGILAPGNSPGTLTTTGNTVLLGGGTFEFEVLSAVGVLGDPVAGTDYDTMVVTGELDLSGLSASSRFTLDLVSLADEDTAGILADFDPLSTYSFTLIDYGTIELGANTSFGANLSSLFTLNTSGFLDQNGNEVLAGWSVLNDTDRTALVLTYSAIPEPSTYGLILGALALAGAAVRRRRKLAR